MSILKQLQELGEGWKSLVTIFAIVGAGFLAGLTLAGWWTVPSKLRLLEARQILADSTARDLVAQVAGVRRLLRQSLCLQVAEKKKAEWSDCLLDFKP